MIRQRPAVGNRWKQFLTFRVGGAFGKKDLAVIESGIVIGTWHGMDRIIIRTEKLSASVHQLKFKDP